MSSLTALSNEDSGTDGGSDSDDTDLPWDTGTDTDVLILQPVVVFEDPPASAGPSLQLAASFNGSRIAVSRSDIDVTEPYLDGDYSTVFLTFAWDSPEDVMLGSFAEQPPACGDSPYTINMPNSQPHPHPDGFLLLTAARGGGGDDCELTQTLWDGNANLLDGPNAFSGLFSNVNVVPMDPHGIMSDGTATTGSMNGEGFDTDSSADTEGEIVVDVDRWGADGFHERLVHLSFTWPYAPTLIAEQQVRTGWLDQTIFLHNGLFTLLGIEQMIATGVSNIESDTILVMLDTDGGVVRMPERLEDDTPPVPAELEFTTYGASTYTFAAGDDVILELAKTMYMPLDGLAEYDPSIADPYEDRLWSRIIDFDGTPLTDWEQLAEYDTHVTNSFPHVAWSGRYFAACYNEPFDTFKMIAMDGNGVPISEPIRLFWGIPPVENRLLPCDIVAIDEDTFMVILGVYADPPEAYANGLYAVRVDVNIPVG